MSLAQIGPIGIAYDVNAADHRQSSDRIYPHTISVAERIGGKQGTGNKAGGLAPGAKLLLRQLGGRIYLRAGREALCRSTGKDVG